MTVLDSLLEQVEVVPEVLERVQKVREKLHLSSDRCPCDAKSDGRGCVGPVCMQEILEKGRCKCGAYKLKGGVEDGVQVDS